MNDKFLKPYNPAETESRIYKLWEESGFFAPEAHPSVASAKADNPENLPIAESSKLKAKSFSMVMPPPNVTGVLHMGHALMLTLEDIMVRFARMQGKKTLWVPGTDHAAIATQAVVEKEIYKKEGKNRHDLGREEFLKRVETFAAQSHKTITSQIRVMGASCDWSREAFTLDEKRTEAVRSMFKMMYDDGLIYRGHRIVNWDPKGQTTISDDEIVYREEKTVFYYFTYGPFTIGTSRPETKFGDKYVVMHPDDTRYAEYTDGQKIELEWINGPITATVVKDTAIDMEFGSGVMTITPWHDTADFEIAERHKLDKEQIIDERGKLLPIAGEFAGLKIADAREKVVEKLRAKGLVVKEEPYTHNLATAERTGGTIEPQIKLQWFVDVNKPVKARGGKTLKELMREPVAGGKIKIIPEHFEKTYFHWIDNLRDWCISRQIWYGHRIPVWYCPTCRTERVNPEIRGRWLFMRHGETDWNKVRKLQGSTDIPLNDTGREQARIAGEQLKSVHIDLIICSDYKRAEETANIVGKIVGAEVITDSRLRERTFGDAEGMVFEDAEKKYGNGFVLYAGKPANNESYAELEERAMNALAEHAKVHKHKNVLFVSHGGINKAVLRRVRNMDKELFNGANIKIDNAAIISFDVLDACATCGNHLFEQDPDTLDTWFSSGLWTFSTLGWPEKTKDLEMFHPTDVLETGYEILFFWVARMILMSQYALGVIPFKTVYLHGTVRDAKGRKMSKSLGNGIDPIDIAQKFGADAARMTLIVGNTPGTDMRISEEKIRGYKHFANKLWNIARFILENTSSSPSHLLRGGIEGGEDDAIVHGDEKKLLDEQQNLLEEVTRDMEEYRFYLAAEKLYHYTWHTLADRILEESKTVLKNGTPEEKKRRMQFLLHTLDTLLKALHPFIPFVTEEIWGLMGNKELLMVQEWPVATNS